MRWLISFAHRIRNGYSPSAALFAGVIALGTVLMLFSFVAAHYFAVDILSSLTYAPIDGWCNPAGHEGLGVHCFGDYASVVLSASQQNPWVKLNGVVSNYPAAGMVAQWLFGAIGAFFGSHRVGLIGYMVVLVAALVTPAVWASRGKTAAIKLITVSAFGILSIPSLMALDRGNSVALAVPALLAFLVSLRRKRYSETVVSIVLAALVKPQFALLLLIFIPLQKWKQLAATVAAVAATNVAAYLLWPKDFPLTIWQTLTATIHYGGYPLSDQYPPNVSFAKGLNTVELWLRDLFGFSTAHSWMNEHSSVVSFAIVAVVTCVLVVRGRRIPSHIGGMLLIVCASLFVSTTWSYYLVFGLAIAAVFLRDPADPTTDRHSWHGIFDSDASGWSKKVAIFLVMVATAFTLMQVPLPLIARVPGLPLNVNSSPLLVHTTVDLVPILWLLAIAAVLVVWSIPQPRPRNATR